MLLCFELSIPGVGSWNGKWSGADNYYALVRNLGRSKKATEHAQKILAEHYFRYAWSDGWAARISVRQVDSSEAGQIRRRAQGFCEYDWMVQSIIDNLKIITGRVEG